MKLARLGALGVAAGVVVLGTAGPALANGTTTAPSQSAVPGDFRTTISPNPFHGGQTLNFTVSPCSSAPTLKDQNNLFSSVGKFTGSGGTWKASAVTRSNLSYGTVYTITITCGKVTKKYSTKPQKPAPTQKPTTQPTGTVPSGAPQTGDGSSGGLNGGLMAGGAAVVLAGLAGGGYMLMRRRAAGRTLS